MMKKLLLLLVLTISFQTVFSQREQIIIPWNSTATKTVQNGAKQDKDSNALDTSGLQLTEETLLFQKLWKDSGVADQNSLEISNVVYAPLTAAEQKRINKALVPTKFKANIASLDARGAHLLG